LSIYHELFPVYRISFASMVTGVAYKNPQLYISSVRVQGARS
jgi:hypothetical protein